MPVRRYISSEPVEQKVLTERLAAEWQNTSSVESEPVILEEPDRDGIVRHIYVVWSDWAEVSRERRGEIIMEALEQASTTVFPADITIAMGLTPEEADTYGLDWR